MLFSLWFTNILYTKSEYEVYLPRFILSSTIFSAVAPICFKEARPTRIVFPSVVKFASASLIDGGRILILIIEAIRRKPMKENIEQTIILIGFAVIIIFALVVTIFDVGKLFH